MQIYIGNMSYGSTEEDIKTLFEKYGEVESVKLITDRETGRAKGFGFVEMADSTKAQEAIDDLNGKELDGRTLRINEAKPRPERSPRY